MAKVELFRLRGYWHSVLIYASTTQLLLRACGWTLTQVSRGIAGRDILCWHGAEEEKAEKAPHGSTKGFRDRIRVQRIHLRIYRIQA